MKVLHISFECFPAAKVGGLADVVGALPKYLNHAGIDSGVIMPKLYTPWLNAASYEEDYKGNFRWHTGNVPYRILRVISAELGFNLYVVELNELFFRTGVYNDTEHGIPYYDEVERYIAFQLAVLNWVRQFKDKPKIIHCHDHHTALIPVIMKFSVEYEVLKNIPTVFTIHNGLYQGQFSWNKKNLLPYLNDVSLGILDWNFSINPMAAAVKVSNAVTTVSNGYMNELYNYAGGLEVLFQQLRNKCRGIINGIDTDVWNPKTDKDIQENLVNDIEKYKRENKKALCKKYYFDESLPLYIFIGRLMFEKGADLLAPLIDQFFTQNLKANFIILGSGISSTEYHLSIASQVFRSNCVFEKGYNESLAHLMYAGADYLLMPSRVEPCGLNQMYSMRYATIPIVSKVGGLGDTVNDIGNQNGRGIQFSYHTTEDLMIAMRRAQEFFTMKDQFIATRKHISELDFSWNTAAKNYIDLYKSLNSQILES